MSADLPAVDPAPSRSSLPMPTPGADVFISYARENRAVAAQLAQALAGHGLRVWWDRELVAGSRFSERIEAELGSARCVLTLWSADSVRSGFVRDESSRALEAGKLIPVRIEAVTIPLGFGQLHTVDLIGWDGAADDPRLAEVLTAIAAPREPSADADASSPSGGPSPMPVMARPARPRWAFTALAAGVAAALLVGGGLWWQRQADEAEADQRFREGLERQFAREPNLESARNLYLSALAQQPEHARARYYLGHVYAQLGQPVLARAAFERALKHADQLDEAQQADAKRQVAALSPASDEPAALGLASADTAAASTAASATLPPAAPSPAPGVAPPRRTVGGARPGPSSAGGSPDVVAATRLPPRLALSSADQGALAAQVAALFEGSRDVRIRATTSLVLDPEALSDAVPLAVARALTLASLPQPTDTQLSGVINTLVLAQNALPSTLLAEAENLRRLIALAAPQGPATARQAERLSELLTQAEGQRPRAFIQIASESQRALAQALAERLRQRGYTVPGIERVGAARAPQRSEIRVHSKSDRGLARWLAKVMDEFTTETPAISTLRNTRPVTDTFEIWLGADLCEGTLVARCQGGS